MAKIGIDIDLQGDCYVARGSSAECAGWVPRDRLLRRGVAHRYPLPPIAEEATWDGSGHAGLWKGPDDAALYRLNDVLLGDPENGDVERFGEYLFLTLLGPWWQEIEALAPGTAHDIRLSISEGASLLQGLPWELMAYEGRPLIAHPRRHSVSRLVVPRSPVAPSRFDLPLRVLFVVGQADAALRAGAEYLGILRSLDANVCDGGVAALSTILNVRSVADASAESLERAVEAFRPHVVHIVAHGRIEADQPVILLTQKTRNGAVEDPCPPERLLGVLSGTSRTVPLPPLVVLNACYTANQPAEGGPRSFAAALVHGGIAAAIGMSGEVASSACRLFTKAFYGGLASQRSVEEAVALGQYAARLHYETYNRSVEWARPALFLAAGSSFEFLVDPNRRRLLRVASRIRGRPSIMCDRSSALRAYQQFVEATGEDRPAILAFEQSADGMPRGGAVNRAPYQLGKTLLLTELSWHAVLDGYLPCFIPCNEGSPPPSNLASFALRLVDVMDRLRVSFDLPRRETTHVQRTAFLRFKKDEVDYARDPAKFASTLADIKSKLLLLPGVGLKGMDPPQLGELIRRDVADLCADVRAVHPDVRGVLVLIDDVDRYEGFHEYLLDLVNEFGLGTRGAPAPVVLTYAPRRGCGLEVDALLRNHARSVARRTLMARLEPFADDIEGRAAYFQYLLSRKLAPPRGLNVMMRHVLDKTLEVIREAVCGVPSYLDVYFPDVQLNTLKRLEALVPADDESIFAQMVREQ